MNFKRIISLLLCLIMVAGCMQTMVFAGEESTQPRTVDYKMPFYDVAATRWSNPYITLLYTHGVVGGTSTVLFTPAGALTRAQFVKMIYGLSTDELGNGTTEFTDVVSGSWYEPYVAWAVGKGVVNGISPTKFDPDGKITRQDMAVMLYRFTGASEEDYVNAPMVFSDNDKIATYAADAVAAMQRMGVIGGTINSDGTYRFEPKGNATREQAAKVIAELYRKDRGLSLPAPIAPPYFNVGYYGLDGAEVSDLVSSYTYDDSFTLPTPFKAGYEFLGWTGDGIGTTPVKDVKIKKGSYGDKTFIANWLIYPAKKHVIEVIKHNLLTDNDGELDGGYLVKDYKNGDKEFVRIIDHKKEGSITVGRYYIDGSHITGLLIYLTEDGTEYEYIYSDFISGGAEYINAQGKAYGGRFTYKYDSGTDLGNKSAEGGHTERIGNYLSDIYDVLDMYCNEFIPGYGAGTFGLSHT